ncbi:substrate-binding periplasmic protein [Pseudomonas citronellolis]|uniref:substrate-binding periplasmic protein n=1 Tax=Pseudomonas citronellolis TaxID=53408 RepID=UPI0023E3BC02|nr:transporter substrate-binding domain-containing protein [Pseudomonas citronellolis]MDF3935876.1 transporter substrate-binding domain-containing protein [Pseudomonas citronellolis]
MRVPVLTLALLLAGLAQAEPRALNFSVIEGWAMPLAQMEDGRLTGGILYELFNATAREVGMPPAFHYLPRARVEQAMREGNVDVRCYVTPSWVNQDLPGFRWSVPLLTQRDLLVTRTSSAVNVADLSGQNVGTVLGYHYPQLQAAFEAGRLRRDDARTQELVLKKLEAGRYRYAVSSEVALDWFNLRQPPEHRLYPVAQLDQTELACMVLDAPTLPTQAVLDALARLKASGEVERILDHYR